MGKVDGRFRVPWLWQGLKEWNISKDLAIDRSAWRWAINVPEP
jgi:hypothetical protein